MSFLRYPNYKDSGVEWLGEVPEHWRVGLLRYYAKMKTGHTPSRQVPEYWESCTIPWFGLADVWQLRNDRQTYLGETKERISELGLANSAAELLPAGTVVLSRTASVGYSGIMPVPMATTQDFWNWICGPSLDPRYLLLLLRSMRSEFDRLTMGSTHSTIYQPDAASFRVCLPPMEEQRAIVDAVTSTVEVIDELIAEQQRLIELLQEKRQAVVSGAVTRGLHPNAPMNETGAEWLGAVPAHWEVVRLGRLFHEVSEPGDVDLPVLSVSIHSGVSDRELDENELERRVTRSEDRTKYKRVQPGDLVYNMMRAWQGAFGTVAAHGMVSPAYVVARPRPSVLTVFVENLLRTPQSVEQMRRLSRGVTDFRLRLYWDEFKTIEIAIPPRSEAEAICDAISRIDAEFTGLTNTAGRTIALLEERRTALISAAVTGKIDVRNYAADQAEAA